jgi:type IV pilus assembly protein PilM
MYHNVVVYERRLTKGGLGALVRALEQELGLGPEATERLLRQGGVWQAGGTGLAAGGEAAGFAADACFASMVEEMRIPLSYLANQYPEAALERLLLIGGGATLPGLRDYLASGLDVDVQVVRPTDLAACPESLDADYGPALALAIGLAQSDGT